MKKEKVKIEDFIQEELEKEAEDIRQKIDAMPAGESMPAGTEAKIYENLKEQIADYELNKRYPDMPAEDMRALRLGQEMMKRESEAQEMEMKAESAGEASAETVLAEKVLAEKVPAEKVLAEKDFVEKDFVEKEAAQGESEGRKVVYRRKRGKFYLGFAAVLVLVCGLGVTSMGGPARIVTFLKGMVGDREVVKVNSGEDNLVIVEENEEEAYEVIEEEFGVKPAKIMAGPAEIEFQYMEFDKLLQLAELTYSYKEEKLFYFISTSYRNSSWGVDVEDQITDEYTIEKEKRLIEVTEYKTEKSKTKKYSAKFEYMGVEYFMIGTMGKEEFGEILKNLYFFR